MVVCYCTSTRTNCWRYARCCNLSSFYKNEFTFMSGVSIVVVIVTLLIGLSLNKSNNNKDIESIY